MMFCPKCGTSSNDNALDCSKCGFNFAIRINSEFKQNSDDIKAKEGKKENNLKYYIGISLVGLLVLSMSLIYLYTRPKQSAPVGPTNHLNDFMGEGAMHRGNRTRNGVYNGPCPETVHGVRWKREIVYPGDISAFSNVLFVSDFQGGLSCLDKETGNEKWVFTEYTEDRASSYSYPLCIDGVCFIGAASGKLCAVDMFSGETEWSLNVKELPSSPVFFNGKIFFGGNKFLYAIDVRTKQTMFQFPASGKIFSSPTVGNNHVYFSTDKSAEVFCLSTQSGNEVWRFQADSEVSAIAYEENLVFFSSYYDQHYALDANTGKLKWHYKEPNGRGRGDERSPASSNGVVLFGGTSGSLNAFDLETGTSKWQFFTEGLVSSPVICEELVYVASMNIIYAVDLSNGQEVWRMQIDGEVSELIVHQGELFITTDYAVLALD